ncbi:MAG: transcriptional repressor [Solirubrobacteraceae bacterium]
MTVAAHEPAAPVRTLAEAQAALRRSGMRLSTARRLLLEELFAADGPRSAVQLARRLGIDATSVYRNLEVLERHGLVRHVHLGHGPGLYALAGRERSEYLYCERCELATAIAGSELEPLRRALREAYGYEVRFSHFALVGLCAGCAAGATPAADNER